MTRARNPGNVGRFVTNMRQVSALETIHVDGNLARIRTRLATGGISRIAGAWVTAATESSGRILHQLLVGTPDAPAADPFRARAAVLRPQGSFAIVGVFAQFHLAVFRRAPGNMVVVESAGLTPEAFAAAVLAPFAIDEAVRTRFAAVDRDLETDEARAVMGLYELVAEQGFGLPLADVDPMPAVTVDRITEALHAGYSRVFMPRLAVLLRAPA